MPNDALTLNWGIFKGPFNFHKAAHFTADPDGTFRCEDSYDSEASDPVEQRSVMGPTPVTLKFLAGLAVSVREVSYIFEGRVEGEGPLTFDVKVDALKGDYGDPKCGCVWPEKNLVVDRVDILVIGKVGNQTASPPSRPGNVRVEAK